jgi:hypothetical protein
MYGNIAKAIRSEGICQHFSAIRNLAVRALGFLEISSSVASIGLLVRIFIDGMASSCLDANSLNTCFTILSSNE